MVQDGKEFAESLIATEYFRPQNPVSSIYRRNWTKVYDTAGNQQNPLPCV